MVSSLVLFVVLFATRKNNYTLGPFLTDEKGEVTITRKVIEKEIADTKKEFPMDYSDDLSECQFKILVTIESAESLAERWKKLKEYYPDRANKLRRLLDGGANYTTNRFQQEVDLKNIGDVIDVEMGEPKET